MRERRAHFRIVYPSKARPSLTIGEESFPVVDLCERGIRFMRKDNTSFEVGQLLKATITFAHKRTMELVGEILRVQGNETVVFLATRIPHGFILEEQRYLLKNFPGFS